MAEECKRACAAAAAESRSAEAAVFKALGDEKRLRMLDMVAANPGVCACSLLEELDMSQSTLSHHMSLLKAARLVACEKRGKWCHYTLSAEGLDAISRYAAEMRGAGGQRPA
ncbi:MAG: ArsR/SmtB family transcription factor [Coriobacteriales bacterium]